MNKYTTINGKIRHAHQPVGSPKSASYGFIDVPPLDQKCICGYHICAKTGPCAPKGWVAKSGYSYTFEHSSGAMIVGAGRLWIWASGSGRHGNAGSRAEAERLALGAP